MFNAGAGTQQTLRLALQYHQAGNFRQAETLYRQILAAEPGHADALHFLGLLARQTGNPDAAIELITRAIGLNPHFPAAYCNLGNAQRDKRLPDAAIASYRQAIALRPDFAEAYCNLGGAWQDRGELAEAIACYRKAIALRPDYADAFFNLANVLREKKELDESIACYNKAIGFKPYVAEYHNNLANALRDKGQVDEAICSYRKAIALKANLPDAYYNLGAVLHGKGDSRQAIDCYHKAIALRPDFPEAFNNLGNTLCEIRELTAAIAAYRQAIALRPDYPEAYLNLGKALSENRQLDASIAVCRQAIALRPNYPQAHSNLAIALCENREFDAAIAACHQAIALRPDFPQAYSNLGTALAAKGESDAAIGAYRQAVALKPDHADTHNNLASALHITGLTEEAIAEYRLALSLEPDSPDTHSNLINTLHFHPDYGPQDIAQELRRWNSRHAEPLKKFIQPHCNDRSSDRRLRIGYLSPDLREHVVARFLLPLLAHHDKNQVEVFAYAHSPVSDQMTQRLQSHTDGWRNIWGMSDSQTADLIRQDRIDILVDLAMHTAHNRLLVLARKPAPVQVTYLAYCSSSGLEAMDYRLSDPYLDPPGMDESVYSERTIRLEETYWCYQSIIEVPDVGPLKALSAGHVTFGCLNNFCKTSPLALQTWCRLLLCVPESHLVLHALEGSHRRRTIDVLTEQGIDPDRLHFVGYVPAAKYFQRYEDIDIALDPFPYPGGTTTCDALWMGVPVVSLAGQTAVSRGGLSILSNVGLAELAAHTTDQYIKIAADLANDLPRLAELRSTLRAKMQASALMDAPRFTRNVESAYRSMWRNWCVMERETNRSAAQRD